METGGADMSRRRNAPDPRALAIAQEIQERLHPAEVILLGSRAAGDHRPDSDVDLMAVVPDETAAREADETLRRLLAGKYEAPVVNVLTMTREEFRRTAPLAQSRAGQAARHGVTPKGRSLDYRPERQPEAEEILQASIFWLVLAETHLDTFILFSEDEILAGSDLHAYQGPAGLGACLQGAADRRQRRRQVPAGRGADVVVYGGRPARGGPAGRPGNGGTPQRHRRTGRTGMPAHGLLRGFPAGRPHAGAQRTGAGGRRPPPGAGGQHADSRGADPLGRDPGGYTAGKASAHVQDALKGWARAARTGWVQRAGLQYWVDRLRGAWHAEAAGPLPHS